MSAATIDHFHSHLTALAQLAADLARSAACLFDASAATLGRDRRPG